MSSPVDEQARRAAILAAAQADSDATGDGTVNSVDFDNAERMIRAYDAALAAARPVPEGVTHALVAGAEDAGHESATVCGSLPLDEPSADLARVDCLSCLRFLAAAAVSPVPRDAGDERQPDGLTDARCYADASVAEKQAAEALRGFRAETDDPLGRLDMARKAVRAFLAAVSSVTQAPAITIYIDHEAYPYWPGEVTGERLYQTVAVEKPGFAVWQEVPDGEDELVPPTRDVLPLEGGERFYSTPKNIAAGAQAPTPEDEPRGDDPYENGRGARASGRSLQENPYRREADYARWAQGWLDEHHGKPRIVRTSTGTEDVGNGPCIRCGRSDYAGLGGAYWFADNDLWNEIVEDRVGIFCPACFALLCAEKGIAIGFRAGRVGVIEEGPADTVLAAWAKDAQNDAAVTLAILQSIIKSSEGWSKILVAALATSPVIGTEEER